MKVGATFVIRVWQDGDVLRFRLENAGTRQHWTFTTMIDLWAFLQTQFPSPTPPHLQKTKEK